MCAAAAGWFALRLFFPTVYSLINTEFLLIARISTDISREKPLWKPVFWQRSLPFCEKTVNSRGFADNPTLLDGVVMVNRQLLSFTQASRSGIAAVRARNLASYGKYGL